MEPSSLTKDSTLSLLLLSACVSTVISMGFAYAFMLVCMSE